VTVLEKFLLLSFNSQPRAAAAATTTTTTRRGTEEILRERITSLQNNKISTTTCYGIVRVRETWTREMRP